MKHGSGEGRSGFVTCCMHCKKQIDFFVDDELTRIEAEPPMGSRHRTCIGANQSPWDKARDNQRDLRCVKTVDRI